MSATVSVPRTHVDAWQMVARGEPLARASREITELGAGDALVRVAGCGVCHTDIGYLYEGVATRHPLPLTLGHEIAGTVENAGPAHARLVGRKVVVPAVIPCGRCALCQSGREMICPEQIFPGCDVHGGFASHVVVPAHGLCVVDDAALEASGLELADLSVLGDAVSTAYHAIDRARLPRGGVAVFIGAGGVGGFGVQIARARGAHVVAMDVDPAKLARMTELGASLTLDVRGQDPKATRKQLTAHLRERGLPERGVAIFETSGTAAGQELAFGLLGPGAHLSVVGFTLDRVTVRLSNLMAFDATAAGVWGCPPRLYPSIVDLVLRGEIRVAPFIERRPMSEINEVLEAVREHRMKGRPVLIP
ncbi:MAG: 6-hydroxycyclohex-1-ene-1-carbonyl-CoA dehydrogenase [Myxococcales bacterium]|nr:6-hydroxycyclohex-1-ene-1-carbonyl-CoA dehydrogenase [Myxococcales bacterium]